MTYEELLRSQVLYENSKIKLYNPNILECMSKNQTTRYICSGIYAGPTMREGK